MKMDLCEVVLDYWKERYENDEDFKNNFSFKGINNPQNITSQDIFNCSPSGELAFIYFWVLEAVDYKQKMTGNSREQIVQELISKYAYA